MSKVCQLYYNPNCSKCRSALEILDAKEMSVDVVRYLEQTLQRDELDNILENLTDPIQDIVRKDRRFAELGLNASNYNTREAVINLLLQHPELMQRPIIKIHGKFTIVRSKERVLEVVQD